MKVCFIGHRKIEITDELKTALMKTFEKLINTGVDTFLFGSRSVFDTLCWEVIHNINISSPIKKEMLNIAFILLIF